MRHTEAETQAEREAGSVQGARRGTRSRISRIRPWAEGGAKPLGHPGIPSKVQQPDYWTEENDQFKHPPLPPHAASSSGIISRPGPRTDVRPNSELDASFPFLNEAQRLHFQRHISTPFSSHRHFQWCPSRPCAQAPYVGFTNEETCGEQLATERRDGEKVASPRLLLQSVKRQQHQPRSKPELCVSLGAGPLLVARPANSAEAPGPAGFCQDARFVK